MRTIVLMPTGRDAQLMSAVIERTGNPCHIVKSVAELCEAIRSGAGAAVVAEEALRGDAITQLHALLDSGSTPEIVLGQIGWIVRDKFPRIAPGRVSWTTVHPASPARPGVDTDWRTASGIA